MMRRRLSRREAGFSLLEVILAVAVLGVVLAGVSITILSSIRNNSTAGSRTQAAQVLNYFGRRLAGGEVDQLGALMWDYGTLASAFEDLAEGSGLADPNLYRVEIRQEAPIGIGSALVPHYAIRTCWQNGDGEICLTGDTAGAAAGAVGSDFLPGIN